MAEPSAGSVTELMLQTFVAVGCSRIADKGWTLPASQPLSAKVAAVVGKFAEESGFATLDDFMELVGETISIVGDTVHESLVTPADALETEIKRGLNPA